MIYKRIFKIKIPATNILIVPLLLYIFQNQHRHFGIKDVAGKPMRAINMFSILIKYFKDCFLEEISKCTDQFSERDVDFVLTIPALCGEGTKIIMREAAIRVSPYCLTSLFLVLYGFSLKELCINRNNNLTLYIKSWENLIYIKFDTIFKRRTTACLFFFPIDSKNFRVVRSGQTS